ncbi:MAG: hypothetical protein AAGL17_22165, partial [Cyanobacteria bacterium J06576_12]
WRMATGEEIARLSEHTNDVASVAFSADGEQLASASFDRTIRLWNTADMSEVKPDGPPLVGHTQNVWAVEFFKNRPRLVSGSADLSLRWWPSEWSAWPSMACDRLKNHPLLALSQDEEIADSQDVETADPEIVEIAREGKSACDTSFWQK